MAGIFTSRRAPTKRRRASLILGAASKKAKRKESKPCHKNLCHKGRALMENRNGLAAGGTVTHATGTAEREASEAMLATRVKQTA